MAELAAYISQVEQAMEEATSLYAELNWNVKESHSDYTISTKPTSTDCHAFKVEYFFPKNPLASARYVFDHLIESANRQVDLYDFYREVERFGPDAFTAHCRAKGQAIVSSREFTFFICYLQLSETTSAIIGKSVDLPEVQIGADAVKANLDFGMYLFEPVGEDASQTHFIHVSRVDPKGSIPAALVNARLSSVGVQIKNTINAVLSAI